MNIYIYIYTCIYIHAFSQGKLLIYIYIYVYTYMHINIHIHIYIYIHTVGTCFGRHPRPPVRVFPFVDKVDPEIDPGTFLPSRGVSCSCRGHLGKRQVLGRPDSAKVGGR